MNKFSVNGDETGEVASNLIRKDLALHFRFGTLFFG